MAGRTTAAGETTAPDGDAEASSRPLLSDEAWNDLSRSAPEITDSIAALQKLAGALYSFDRPLGPDEAVTMLDGIETIDRLVESLSVIVLSVLERSGTPRDYGAKSTQALVADRLQVSGREASRRVKLAESLGKRVDISGQSREPMFPVVSEALLGGQLSAIQAGVIAQCLRKLPRWATDEQRAEAERLLVAHAPTVRVQDIRVLFDEILAWIDPDGQVPDDTPNPDEYFVNLRAREDGSWMLKGHIDPVTGGIMHGLLTSRITSDPAEGTNGGETEDTKPAGGTSPAGDSSPAGGTAPSEGPAAAGETSSRERTDARDEVVAAFDSVLSGDRHDALDPTIGDEAERGVPGYGVREDGTRIGMTLQQPSIRTRIYSRFATLVSRIEMNRIGTGAPYALVVTAKASDLASGSGQAVTGADTRFPITTAAREGLNGTVFFHLMSEKARTVEVCTEKRFANAKQLAILAARDQGCTFPGCDTPPGWCVAHHVVEWAQGGNTDINNLTLACGAHHRLLDKSDWETVMLRDGRPAWRPPASIDPARKPILHARFVARGIADTLFD
ncbi:MULTISPECIES: HNH endonuclease signature motif containing protein [Brevibacterium]|uniref:HNH endonuclease signature motif containing protein n=1 Tax=Brevibacterium TaxID=1696 RepID=UPI001C692D4D|nr:MULTISPECIES: HNH endonuclease signature motif containing protein [Brevibacterium]